MTDMNKIVDRAAHEAYQSWAAMPNREAYVRQSMSHAAAVAVAHATAATTRAIEARVRAEVAEEIARYFDGLAQSSMRLEAETTATDIRVSAYHGVRRDTYESAAEVARAFAAGSSRDTTPQEKP